MAEAHSEVSNDARHIHERPALVDPAKPLGPYVKSARKAQGLRIDDAASLFGVSVDTLSRLENGVGAVRLDKLLAVLDGLGLALLVGAKSELAGIVRNQGALPDEHDE
jgi:transcriptional regulator with XRE-family HTH domain